MLIFDVEYPELDIHTKLVVIDHKLVVIKVENGKN
jgi:hypothetical protein